MEDAEARFLLASYAIIGDYSLEGIASVWVVALTFGIDPASLNQTYDALIAGGLISKTEIPTRFHLTEKGKSEAQGLLASGYTLPSEAEASRLKEITKLEGELSALRRKR